MKDLSSIFDPDKFMDLSAERAVVGAVLVDPELYWVAREYVRPSDFEDETCRKLFIAVSELVEEKGNAWDEVALLNLCRKKGWNEITKGDLVELYEEASPEVSLPTACEIVKEKSLQRKLKDHILRSISLLKEGKLTLEGLASSVHALIEGEAQVQSEPLSLVVKNLLNELVESTKEEKTDKPSFFTGYDSLDLILNGLQVGEYVVVGARPSMGKTALAVNLALKLHSGGEKPSILFVSLEMPADQIALRVLSCISGVRLQALRSRVLAEESIDKLARSYVSYHEELERVRILDANFMTTSELQVQIVKHVNKYETRVVIVDYLQLLWGRRKNVSEYERVTEVSRTLKAIAKKYNLLVIALAQLSRESEKRQDKVPQLADLRSSGQIEQDADVIMLLHRPGAYMKNPSEEERKQLEVYIRKHRNGQTGKAVLLFDGDYQRIEDALRAQVSEFKDDEIVEEPPQENSKDEGDVDEIPF